MGGGGKTPETAKDESGGSGGSTGSSGSTSSSSSSSATSQSGRTGFKLGPRTQQTLRNSLFISWFGLVKNNPANRSEIVAFT
jgi:hypothetical protein